MKNLILATFALVMSAQISCAGLLADMVGKWKVNNMQSGSSITTTFKRVGAKGLQSKSIIVIPGLANGNAVNNYKANGTVTGKVTRGGVVQVSISGTWRISGKTLYENVRLTSPTFPGVVRQTSKIKLVNANKLSTVSTVDGTRDTGSLSRVR